MSPGSLKFGSFRGIPISAHYSALLIAVVLGSNLFTNYGVLIGVIAMVGFFASIIAHELGHALVAKRHGVQTESIELWALGGVARLDRESPNARSEGWIAAAGPLTSLTIGLVAIVSAVVAVRFAGLQVRADTSAGNAVSVVIWLGIVNTALALFNLLPGSPLDGGRILKAWRWGRHGDRYRATREAANAGRTLGWSIAAFGGVMVVTGYPGLMLAVTGIFIAVSARAEDQANTIVERLQGVRVGDLTWFGVAQAPCDTDADTMVFQRSRLGQAGVVALSGPNGELQGLVEEDQLLAIPDAQRAQTSMSSLMTPMAQLAHADPDEALGAVLSRLNPRRPILTVWRDGKLLGVVPKKLLLSKIAAAQASN